MLDISISTALAILTIVMAYLGVHVTLHPPGESVRTQRLYKGGFLLCGIVAVSLVILQGVRANRAQQGSANQITNLESDIRSAKTEAQNARTEVSNARTEVQNESARRQQAEKDLLLTIQGTTAATRKGVAEDIRKTPLKVSGAGARSDEEKTKREAIRVKLGYMMNGGRGLMGFCITPPQRSSSMPPFSCEQETRNWEIRCAEYVVKNMDASYLSRFESATGPGVTWPGADQKTNNILWRLKCQTDVLEKFIQELLD
jgi:hypothetical protein